MNDLEVRLPYGGQNYLLAMDMAKVAGPLLVVNGMYNHRVSVSEWSPIGCV